MCKAQCPICDQYVKVLKTKLMPQLEEWSKSPSAEQLIFQQDNAPCHVAKSVKVFMKENRIQLLDWPGNSPDLNPIEHIWKMLKNKINRESTSSNKRELTERLLHTWFHDKDLKQCARRLIKDMLRRVQAVIEAHGGTTNY